MPDTTVTLYSYNATTQQWCQTPTGGSGTRLVLSLAPGPRCRRTTTGSTCPTRSTPSRANIDTRIYDIYGNQLDGEFLGDATSTLAQRDRVPRPASRQHPVLGDLTYQDLLSTGVYR